MVIAIDPHKASWTAAVVDASSQPVATIRVPVSRDGYRALRRFADRWPDPTWAIEGASGLGAPLTARLRTDGIDVVDVPAKLAARVRMLSTGHGRKNDDADAVSVAIAARSARRLNSAAVDGRRHRPTRDRRAPRRPGQNPHPNRQPPPRRAHPPHPGRRAAVTSPPSGPPSSCAGSVPAMPPARTLRGLATDLVAEIRQLDRRIAKAAADIQTAVTDSGTTLTELCGIGALTAGKILGRVGTIDRFRSAAAFATYTGTAPIDVSSGDVVRHRLSRAGDRQLNLCLHVMALTQIRQDTPGRAYYLRKRTEGKSHKEAMRCLKRRLSDVVYRQLRHDANRLEAGPGGHSGAALSSSAASSNPAH